MIVLTVEHGRADDGPHGKKSWSHTCLPPGVCCGSLIRHGTESTTYGHSVSRPHTTTLSSGFTVDHTLIFTHTVTLHHQLSSQDPCDEEQLYVQNVVKSLLRLISVSSVSCNFFVTLKLLFLTHERIFLICTATVSIY